MVEEVGLVLSSTKRYCLFAIERAFCTKSWTVVCQGFCSCGIHSSSDLKAYILQDILEKMGVSQKHASEVQGLGSFCPWNNFYFSMLVALI